MAATTTTTTTTTPTRKKGGNAKIHQIPQSLAQELELKTFAKARKTPDGIKPWSGTISRLASER